MVNILVVEHERSVRNGLKEILIKCGYDVIEAPNGREALETAGQDKIDGILLDVNHPVMDGWQVLSKLKENLKTNRIPVIMLTSYTSVENEAAGIRMGISHFIAKPWRSETLAITITVALRDAQREAEENGRDPMDVGPSYRTSPALSSMSGKVIGAGGKLMLLDRVLGVGIPLESLTLIGGPSRVGKSVLCQYLIYGAILSSLSPTYFTTENTADSLIEQMGSIGLNVSGRIQEDAIRTYPLQSPSAYDEPDSLLAELASNIERVPQNRGLIILDGITELAQISRNQAVLGFFTSCQRQCNLRENHYRSDKVVGL
jgi:CheY-like chemotaxis protein